MLLVHDHFVVLTNNISPVVSLHFVPCFLFTSLWIVNRYNFLSSSRFAAGVDTRRLHRSKHAARRSTWATRHQAHDRTQVSGRLWRDYLIEHLGRQVVLDLGFHQLAFHVSNRCRSQGHLKWRHLPRVTLPVADQRQVVTSHLFTGDDGRFTWREGFLYCISARIPNLGLSPATKCFPRSVVRANSSQLGRPLQTFWSKLNSHLCEVLIARYFVRLINLYLPMYFAWTTIVEDDICAGRRIVTTTTTDELGILFASQKRRDRKSN